MSVAPPPATEADNLFSAETTWFHVFKSMIESGDAARLGGTVFLVYCVIKAHTNFKQGAAFPSVETIARLAGVIDRQVMRALQTLEENGYLTKARHGRNNVYTLREKVTLNDPEGRPAAVGDLGLSARHGGGGAGRAAAFHADRGRPSPADHPHRSPDH